MRLPLEGAFHFPLFLVGFLELDSNSGQELLEVGQEVWLIAAEPSPQATHIGEAGENREKVAQSQTPMNRLH